MKRIKIVDTIIEKNGKILMLKRNFKPENKLDFLGGFVDSGETIKQAAIREAQEESGYEVKLIEKLGKYDYYDRGNKTTHVFIGQLIGGRLRKSIEGTPLWKNPKNITAKDLAFPQVHIKVLKDFIQFKKM